MTDNGSSGRTKYHSPVELCTREFGEQRYKTGFELMRTISAEFLRLSEEGRDIWGIQEVSERIRLADQEDVRVALTFVIARMVQEFIAMAHIKQEMEDLEVIGLVVADQDEKP